MLSVQILGGLTNLCQKVVVLGSSVAKILMRKASQTLERAEKFKFYE